MIVEAGHSLPSSHEVLSIASYNVMMPNENDGWWMYKMFLPSVDTAQHAAWPARRAKLRARIASADADIVCIQEASGATSAAPGRDDFDFMAELGYGGRAAAKSQRMHCATFWKQSKVALVGDVIRASRDLITRFEVLSARRSGAADAAAAAAVAAEAPSPAAAGSRVWVVNTHLPAGHQAARQLRSLHDLTEKIRKCVRREAEAQKSQPSVPPQPRRPPNVVIVGDFNSDAAPWREDAAAAPPASSLDQFLRTGVVAKGVADPTTGELLCTKRPKMHVLGAFRDAYEEGYRCAASAPSSSPPPTVVYPDLYSKLRVAGLVAGATAGAPPQWDTRLSAALTASLARMFEGFGGGVRSESGGGERVLSRAGVSAWDAATRVGAPAPKGAATVIMERKQAAGGVAELSFEEFVGIYRQCLDGGKPWEVAHDLWATRSEAGCLPPVAALPSALGAPFAARFDRVWFNNNNAGESGGLRVVAVLATRTDAQTKRNEPLPNAWSASDHLMIGASFALA
jgi:endonuclease/exonuclease/phosphatase family metal-dependent hydrolase